MSSTRHLCPSAQPDMEGAHVIGVIDGTPEAPRVAYLKKSATVDAATISNLGDIDPTHVFRFAAKCDQARCAHFSGERCTLGERIATMLEPVVDTLPSCQIRPNCRWHAERGPAVCLRCPQVVTMTPRDGGGLHRAALPQAHAD